MFIRELLRGQMFNHYGAPYCCGSMSAFAFMLGNNDLRKNGNWNTLIRRTGKLRLNDRDEALCDVTGRQTVRLSLACFQVCIVWPVVVVDTVLVNMAPKHVLSTAKEGGNATAGLLKRYVTFMAHLVFSSVTCCCSVIKGTVTRMSYILLCVSFLQLVYFHLNISTQTENYVSLQ